MTKREILGSLAKMVGIEKATDMLEELLAQAGLEDKKQQYTEEEIAQLYDTLSRSGQRLLRVLGHSLRTSAMLSDMKRDSGGNQ
jgi:hypothetical protein